MDKVIADDLTEKCHWKKGRMKGGKEGKRDGGEKRLNEQISSTGTLP